MSLHLSMKCGGGIWKQTLAEMARGSGGVPGIHSLGSRGTARAATWDKAPRTPRELELVVLQIGQARAKLSHIDWLLATLGEE